MRNTIAKLLGKRIRQLRAERGLTGAEVSEAIDVDKSTISSFEIGRYSPSMANLAHIAVALRVDELDLLTFPGEHPRHDLIELTRGLPASTCARLLEVCQKVLDEEQPVEALKARTRRHRR